MARWSVSDTLALKGEVAHLRAEVERLREALCEASEALDEVGCQVAASRAHQGCVLVSPAVVPPANTQEDTVSEGDRMAVSERDDPEDCICSVPANAPSGKRSG